MSPICSRLKNKPSKKAECLTIRWERRLQVFDNRTLRIVFGSGKDEIIGGRRKLHEELRKLYYSLNATRLIKLRKMRLAGHVVRMSG
jgi:hypothetical protein